MDGAPIWRMAIMRGRDRLYHGLDTEERDRRRDRDKMRDAAIGFLLVLRRRAKPDLRPAITPIGRQHVADVLRSFRQQKPVERGCRADQ